MSTGPLDPIPDPAPATERGRRRRERIIAAATEVFLEQGFEAAAMAEIGRRAGGSMETLYRQFGSKESLFRAIVEPKVREVYAPLEKADIHDRAPADALLEVGLRLSRLSLSREALMLHRIVFAESHRNPRLPEIVFELGPGRARDLLAAYLESRVRHGDLAIGDCAIAAMQFLEMVKGTFFMRAILGDPPDSDDPAVEAAVRQAVHTFLYGVANRGG